MSVTITAAQNARPESSAGRLNNSVRWPFIMLCCAPLLALRIWILFAKQNLYDFITYWASGRLFLTGGHPYSTVDMLATERLLGWPSDQPMMTFCAPWTLPLVSVAAFFPFRVAQTGWLVLSLLLNCASSVGLWKYFGGELRKSWIALITLATFLPMGGAERLGQINSLMLASLTAFLLLVRSRRYFLAGLALLGLASKPHLVYLLWLAILLWAVQARAWRLLAGAALSIGAAIEIALLYNPNSAEYLNHSVNAALEISCGLGWLLRAAFGVEHRWLQFLPSVFGILWFFWYWSKHRLHWDWQTYLPLLILVSVSTSPYFWFHDFILVFPALIAIAVRGAYRSYNVLVFYLALQLILFCAGLSTPWMAAISVLWLVLYETARRPGKESAPIDDLQVKAQTLQLS